MAKPQSSVDIVYASVREMAAAFAFKPDERINEVRLARELGISRTPLREALNRLVAEGFLTFRTGQGFYCRSLAPEGIMDLYQARQAIECEGLRLAVPRATQDDIAGLRAFLEQIRPQYSAQSSARTLVDLDEDFHMRTIALSGNDELARILSNLNARMRYVRWIDMEDRRDITPAGHMRIVDAIAAGNAAAAMEEMRTHIGRRSEEARDAVQRAYSQLYVPKNAT